MSTKLYGLIGGIVIGFLFAWAGLSNPEVIRNMLMLRDAHVFLLMGSTIAVAAIGVRLLRVAHARTLVGNEPIAWAVERAEPRHVWGSLLFGAGWSLAATCPGPVAVMIGEGRLSGLFVAFGLLAGVTLQGIWQRSRTARKALRTEVAGAAGL